MNRLYLLLSVILCVSVQSASAQEILLPAPGNNVVQTAKVPVKQHPLTRSVKAPLSLPFIDDFSYPGPFPDTNKWVNNYVYINNTMPIEPPTWGVATFDGLNQYGQPYDTSGILVQGGSDSLTSAPINLGGLHASDSVYLSFFYQPAGNGDWPEDNDTLILEILNKNGNWVPQWKTVGPTYPGAVPPFQQVLIPIVADSFLDSSFQFRFREWCTKSGNNDDYNIDYVKLDKKRNKQDTLLNDVACQYMPSNILKHYTSMPWKQFYNYQSLELKPVVQLYLRNNKNIRQSTNFKLRINNITDNISLLSTKNPSALIPALSDLNDITDTFHLKAFTASSSNPIEIKSISNIAAITGDPVQTNDTCYRITRFSDYLSYDDGSAEKVYGIQDAGGKLAYKFTVNTPDTLTAVAFNFQRHNSTVSSKLFSIIVWSSITPGKTTEKIMYRKDFQSPKYKNWDAGFNYFVLDTPQVVSGTFYVGWQQTDADLLNVGYDVNDTATTNIYYDVGSGWTQSLFSGSLLIRPVFGKNIASSGVKDMPVITEKLALTLYPNPASNNTIYLKVTGLDFVSGYTEVVDLYGRRVYYGLYKPTMDISAFVPGVYFVRVYNNGNNLPLVTKFVKQ